MNIRGLDAILAIAAGAACIVGGGILLAFESVGSTGYSLSGHNFFETLCHGAGLYCIGQGMFIWIRLRRPGEPLG